MTWTIDKTVQIAAPQAIVWEVITDVARYGEWNPFVVKCTSTLKPGDPIDMMVKILAKPQRQVEQMLENEPGRKLAYRMKPVPLGTLSSYRSHELESRGEDATSYRSYFRLQGWLMGVVRGLMGSKLEAGFEGMTQGIKRRSEELWAQRLRKFA
jgi:hypothetical protein